MIKQLIKHARLAYVIIPISLFGVFAIPQTTLAEPNVAPLYLNVVFETNGTQLYPKLIWDNTNFTGVPCNPTSLSITRGAVSLYSGNNLTFNTQNDGPSFTPAPTLNTSYTWTVTYTGSCGTVATGSVTRTTPTAYTAQTANPPNFTSTVVNNTIQMSWGNANGAIKYEVYLNGRMYYTGTALNYTATGLTQGKYYYLHVDAVNSANYHSWNTSSKTAGEPLPTPTPTPSGGTEEVTNITPRDVKVIALLLTTFIIGWFLKPFVWKGND